MIRDALARTAYNAVVPLAAAAGPLAARLSAKMEAALAGRAGFRERWRGLAAAGGPAPVWFHVASVGEFEQAQPVIAGLARRHPDLPVLLTFSSPSGYEFARRRQGAEGAATVRFVDYLPVDTRANMRLCFDCARPRLVVLVKFDLWPNMIWEAQRRGVPVVLVDATLSPSSARVGAAGRWFYHSVYAALDRIVAISDDDAERFRRSVPEHAGISVAGDTRFDRVVERLGRRATTSLPYRRPEGPVVIAGSTWPQDEAHVLPALARLLGEHASVHAIVAPHEPTPEHLEPIEAWAREAGLPHGRMSAAGEGPPARVTVIDTVGILAEAYDLADVAYVGGAFSTGVHSVIEPAVAGLPVLFGPDHRNSYEASMLIEQGAGFVVLDASEVHARLSQLLDDDGARQRAGEAARSYVESQLGATEKCLAIIEQSF